MTLLPSPLTRCRPPNLRGGMGVSRGGIHACLRLRMLTGGCAAAPVEQGSKAHTALGKKSKMGPPGPHFHFLAERVGFEPTKGY